MKIYGIDHVAIAVRDLEAASSFFTKLLGTSFGEIMEFDEIAMKSVISPEGIELVTPTTSESQVAKFLEKRGEGLFALSFRVKDADKSAAEAETMGVRITGRIERDKITRFKKLKETFTHPKDGHGVQFLFTEYEEA